MASSARRHPRPRPPGPGLRVGLVVLVFLALFHRSNFAATDELALYEVTRSLVERGSLAVPPMPASYPGRGGLHYSQYAVGYSVLAIPFYLLGKAAGRLLPRPAVRALEGFGVIRGGRVYRSPEIFGVLLLPAVLTAVLVSLLFRFQRDLGVSAPHAALVGLVVGTSTHVAYLSTLFLAHTAEAATLLGSFWFTLRWRRAGRLRDLTLASLLASLLLLIRIPAAILAVGFWAYAAASLWPGRSSRPDPQKLPGIALALALPPFVIGLAHVALNLHCWGSPFDSPLLRQGGDLGHSPIRGIQGLLVSPGCSVLLYSPALLLVPLAWRSFGRQHRAVATAVALTFVTALLFCSSYRYWHGLYSAAGPRYLTATVPLLLLSLGPWLDEGGRGRRTAVALVAALGIAVQVPLMAAHWGALIGQISHLASEPAFEFLFEPRQSPILASLRFFLRGGPSDLWIVWLARGWPGQLGHPAWAALLFALWLVALGLSLRSLGRGLRREASRETAVPDLGR